VCSLSKFFHLACRKREGGGGNFKEAESGIINLPSRKFEPIAAKPEDFKWDADAEDPKYVKLMIHYFYHLDYLEEETAKLKTQKRDSEDFNKTYMLKTGILIDHASMYATGDKYGVPGLRALARKKYQEAYLHTSAGFANSMIVTYTSTIDNDMSLRSVIIEIMSGNLTYLISKPDINEIVKGLPGLSHALLRKSLVLPP
jgi:hypothetical protein